MREPGFGVHGRHVLAGPVPKPRGVTQADRRGDGRNVRDRHKGGKRHRGF
jgi:hypothetical protein